MTERRLRLASLERGNRRQKTLPAAPFHEQGLRPALTGDPPGVPQPQEEDVRPKTALAVAVVLGALAIPTAALPQAALVTTGGQAGHGSLSVGPTALKHKGDAAQVSARAGAGEGSAATASAATDQQAANASVGCAAAQAATGQSSLDATLGDCSSAGGGGGGASGGGDGGTASGDVAGDVTGDVGADLPRDAAAGDVIDDLLGDAADEDTGEADDGGGSAGDVAGDEVGSGGGDQSDGGAGGAGCGTFEQMANMSAFGPVPLWALVLGAFLAGAFFARRGSGTSRT
jgi:hypothetical protein